MGSSYAKKCFEYFLRLSKKIEKNKKAIKKQFPHTFGTWLIDHYKLLQFSLVL